MAKAKPSKAKAAAKKPAPKKAASKKPEPKKPTAEEIKKQIAALRAIKPKVRETSAFGDNHHDSIDAQIEVLEKNLTESMIDNRSVFEDEDTYGDEDEDRWKTNVRESAYDARRWLDGEYKDYPDLIGAWKELVS